MQLAHTDSGMEKWERKRLGVQAFNVVVGRYAWYCILIHFNAHMVNMETNNCHQNNVDVAAAAAAASVRPQRWRWRRVKCMEKEKLMQNHWFNYNAENIL